MDTYTLALSLAYLGSAIGVATLAVLTADLPVIAGSTMGLTTTILIGSVELARRRAVAPAGPAVAVELVGAGA